MKRRIPRILALLIMFAALSGCYTKVHTPPVTVPTDPSTVPQPESTFPVSTDPAPTTPQEPTVPPTTKPRDPDLVGSLYTRAELMAMDSTPKEYGCGIAQNGKPGQDALNCQNKYGQYGAYFYVPDTNEVYLTFDCGYEYSFQNASGKTVRVTEWILDVLKEKNVKGVFFVTMAYCRQSPDLVQRMVDEGHNVGNHTANHPNLAKLDIDKEVEEIMTLHDYVKEHFGYSMNLLRPPEGAYSVRSLATAASLGYTSVDWSVAHADWDPSNQPNAASALSNMVSRAHPGAIYLLHAVSATNATILGDLIDALSQQGYTVARLG